ncbi:MAG: hypothetical protein A2033_04555 [Bacteroidetes bacterium GWA2_31_9]|nr:MAG: hypothetical protein A2033_04555 [Bacteroidetes bacterium GWA2_31_9]
MKKILFIIASLLISNYLIAQNEVDALRYSQNFYGGTARSVSMGSAFGALGGDFSCLSTNPAGIGVYRKTELTFTPSLFYASNKSTYLGSGFSDYKYNFNLNNFGFVAAFNSGEDKGWVNLNIGFGYNRLNNFNNNVLIIGANDKNSMTDYFALRANGQTSTTLEDPENSSYFNEGLAWMSYLIDPDTIINNKYHSALKNYGEVQRKSIKSDGSMGEYLFSMGANYSHKFYLGGTIGIQSVRYEENSVYKELDDYNVIDSFASFTFNQHLKTSGAGFNFKIGTIFRPVDWVRLGFALHTPTLLALEDEYQNSIESDLYANTADGYVDTVITLSSPTGKYQYELATPLRAMGSIGFVIKKIALISVDYEFVDYSTARLRADDYDFYDENNNIQMNYTAASNIRAGAEYRFENYAFRGGYSIYGNPFNTSNMDNNTKRTSYSLGFGIREENFFFDLAFVHSISKEKYYLYNPNMVKNDPATISTTNNQVLATFGFKF